MDRGTLIGAVAAGLIAVPLAMSAQTATAARRIGVLDPDDKEDYAPLRALGWVEGKNLPVERRYANGRAELLRSFAEELVRLKVEIIVTDGTAATLAGKNAPTTIPVIMYSVGDPVRSGLGVSLARPGGNITGYSIVGPEINAKRLAVLRELLPNLQRVGVLANSTNPISAPRAKSSSRRASRLACSRS
jgi:putative tryptophan/tyrosine transport system substrate-binding protein